MDSLRANRPKWVLYQPISREEFLRVFPHATGLDHRFPAIEEYLAGEYEQEAEPPIQFAGYRLLRRKVPVDESVLLVP